MFISHIFPKGLLKYKYITDLQFKTLKNTNESKMTGTIIHIICDGRKIKKPGKFGTTLEKSITQKFGKIFDIPFLFKYLPMKIIIKNNKKAENVKKYEESISKLNKKYGSKIQIVVEQPPAKKTNPKKVDPKKAGQAKSMQDRLKELKKAGLEFEAVGTKTAGFFGYGNAATVEAFIKKLKGTKIASLTVYYGGPDAKKIKKNIEKWLKNSIKVVVLGHKAVKGGQYNKGKFSFMMVTYGMSKPDKKVLDTKFNELHNKMKQPSLSDTIDKLDLLDFKKDGRYNNTTLNGINATGACQAPAALERAGIRIGHKGTRPTKANVKVFVNKSGGKQVEINCPKLIKKLHVLMAIVKKLGVQKFAHEVNTGQTGIQNAPSKEIFFVQNVVDEIIGSLLKADASTNDSFSKIFSEITVKKYEEIDGILKRYGMALKKKNFTTGIRNAAAAYKMFAAVLKKLGIDPKPFEPVKATPPKPPAPAKK